jgi:hypothetical protein
MAMQDAALVIAVERLETAVKGLTRALNGRAPHGHT